MEEADSDDEARPLASSKKDRRKGPKSAVKTRVFNTECQFTRGTGSCSLLVDPDGNQYRKAGQNKTGGTYWRCRFGEHGCTASAITRGFTLECIRGDHTDHTKPPRKPKKPNSSHFTHVNPDIEKWGVKAEITYGKMGGLTLRDPLGNQYYKSSKNGNIIYFMCKRQPYGCKATAKTVDGVLELTTGPHHHVELIHGNDRNSPKFKERQLKKLQAKKLELND